MEKTIREYGDAYTVLLDGEGTKPGGMFGKIYKPVTQPSSEKGVYIGRVIDGKEEFGGACFFSVDLAKLLLLSLQQDIPPEHPVHAVLDEIAVARMRKTSRSMQE